VVKRGEIWLVRLDPTIGSELRKTRPCVVVSPPHLAFHDTFVIVPMTTADRPTRFRVPIEFQGKRGLILPDQIRTVSRERLVRRLGEVEPQILSETLAKLRAAFEE
jgi:mRNA interferase MazF